MATVRKATQEDVPAVLAMCADMHQESPTYRDKDYSRGKMFDLLQHLLTVEGVGGLLVSEAQGKIVGVLAFFVGEYFFGNDRYASDLFVYVKPEHRGGSSFFRMVRAFEAVVSEMGLTEKVLGVSTGINQERVVAAFEGLGYKKFSTGLKKA